MILALVQTFVAALILGLPVWIVLRLLWWNIRAAMARSIDLCFLLKDCLRDRR